MARRRTLTGTALKLLLLLIVSIFGSHKAGVLPKSLEKWVGQLASLVPTSSQTPTDEFVSGEIDLPDAPDRLRIASYNIQVFGQSKISNPRVIAVLARAIRQFDVIAVQEIRSEEQDVLPRFLELVNRDPNLPRYDFLLSPRLGRTVSKEQYAFVYNTAKVMPVDDWVYTLNDPYDRLHRPPFVARFRVRSSPAEEAFTFTLVNIHTDPDETKQELNVLDDVFRLIQQDGSQEDDIILLGDLNVDDKHLGELGQLPGITWAITGVPTNTRGTSQYDNIVFDSGATREFAGYARVYNILERFGFTLEESLEVSDHFPVWADFELAEKPSVGRLTQRPGEVR